MRLEAVNMNIIVFDDCSNEIAKLHNDHFPSPQRFALLDCDQMTADAQAIATKCISFHLNHSKTYKQDCQLSGLNFERQFKREVFKVCVKCVNEIN
jgi:hypothetical protein